MFVAYQLGRSRLNELAFRNMPCIHTTLLVPQQQRGWLKAVAQSNRFRMSLTALAVFEVSRGWLKRTAPRNIESMSVTLMGSLSGTLVRVRGVPARAPEADEAQIAPRADAGDRTGMQVLTRATTKPVEAPADADGVDAIARACKWLVAFGGDTADGTVAPVDSDVGTSAPAPSPTQHVIPQLALPSVADLAAHTNLLRSRLSPHDAGDVDIGEPSDAESAEGV